MATLALNDVVLMLESAIDAAESLDGLEASDDGVKSRVAREVNISLLHLADQLDAASAMVRSQYWLARGKPALFPPAP